jgi:hypothetical protein
VKDVSITCSVECGNSSAVEHRLANAFQPVKATKGYQRLSVNPLKNLNSVLASKF